MATINEMYLKICHQNNVPKEKYMDKRKSEVIQNYKNFVKVVNPYVEYTWNELKESMDMFSVAMTLIAFKDKWSFSGD